MSVFFYMKGVNREGYIKRYSLYDNYTTYFVIGGMGLMYALTLGLCAFFIKQFIVDAIAATGAADLDVIPLLAIILIPPFVIIPIVSYKSHALDRYLLRCTFSKEGICCYGLFWESFFIPWKNIRTYGVQGYDYASTSLVFLFVSTEKEYYRKENIAKISENRIIFQLRDDIVCPLLEFMPFDMKSRLKESIEASRDVYIQRSASC